MSLLTIVQGAAQELGIPTPVAVASSTDLLVKQLFAFAKKEGKELSRRHFWQALHREATFTTNASLYEQADLDEICLENLSDDETFDFDRYIDRSMWNRTSSWPVQGPLTVERWQARVASGTNAGIGNFFRIKTNSISFYPIPVAGDIIYFEYMSKFWCTDDAGNGQETWVADTDDSRLNEELIRLGIVWRFRKAKGLDYGEDFATYEKAVATEWDYDGGRDIIDMTGEDTEILSLTTPEGSWPQS